MGEICNSVFSDGYKSVAHISSTQHKLEAHEHTGEYNEDFLREWGTVEEKHRVPNCHIS